MKCSKSLGKCPTVIEHPPNDLDLKSQFVWFEFVFVLYKDALILSLEISRSLDIASSYKHSLELRTGRHF